MREIKKVFSYARDYKNKSYLSVVLATISVFIGMIPFFLVYKIIMRFVGDIPPTASYILIMGVLILLCLLAKTFAFSRAMMACKEQEYNRLWGRGNKLAEK